MAKMAGKIGEKASGWGTGFLRSDAVGDRSAIPVEGEGIQKGPEGEEEGSLGILFSGRAGGAPTITLKD